MSKKSFLFVKNLKDFKYISVIYPIMNLLKWEIVLFFAWVEENKTLLARKRLIKLLTNCSKTKEKGWKATKTKKKKKLKEKKNKKTQSLKLKSNKKQEIVLKQKMFYMKFERVC